MQGLCMMNLWSQIQVTGKSRIETQRSCNVVHWTFYCATWTFEQVCCFRCLQIAKKVNIFPVSSPCTFWTTCLSARAFNLDPIMKLFTWHTLVSVLWDVFQYLSCCPVVLYRSSLVTFALISILSGWTGLNFLFVYSSPQNVVYLFSVLKVVLTFSIILCCFALHFSNPLKIELLCPSLL